MSSPHIALFLPSLDAGGAERVMVNLARGFVARGLRVDVVLARASGPFLADVPSAARIVDLGARRVLLSVSPLRSYLKRERPLVLLSALHHANIVAVLASKLARTSTRVFISTHNTLSRDTARVAPHVRMLELLLLRACHHAADGVVTVSCGAADDLTSTIKLPRDRIRVIYNPVVTPEMLRAAEEPISDDWFAPGEPPVILGVGRLTTQKDFPTLLRAFAAVRRERPARLMILGDGEDRLRLAMIARELGVEADVHFRGYVRNPHAYIARAAVLVLSSVWEGLPTVLIEGLALDTPVVSTDCESGPREILQNGRFGSLVPVADATAMAGAILAVLNAPRRAAPRDAVRPFELATAVSEYLRVMQVSVP